LIDLGPTILDLMGLSTPSYFMGQSLVPYLAGKTPKLSRPIIAEGRLKQAMVLPNGLKLIRNQREKTFEIYDLTKDPKELDNLYDEMGDQGALEMQKLVQFFQTHQIRKKGYEIPYRR
jgi:arylsulfatase A-like enzyme